MESETLIFVLATIMFFAAVAFGYIPLGLELSSDRLKQLTAIGAGVLIGSAFLVIIPEGLETLEGLVEPSTIGLVILSGFVLMLLLEIFGLPHAIHHDEDKALTSQLRPPSLVAIIRPSAPTAKPLSLSIKSIA